MLATPQPPGPAAQQRVPETKHPGESFFLGGLAGIAAVTAATVVVAAAAAVIALAVSLLF